jgi:hypothetical protein
VASINIKINPQGFNNVSKRLLSLTDREALLRPVAFDLLALMTDRIHDQGKAADGSQIGEYSNSYLKLREKSNRGSDKKIVVSFTRQLENDWSVIATEKGYGIGFKNPFNKQKAQWVEDQKGKKIFKTTAEEKQQVILSIREQVKKLLSGR